MQRFLPLLVIIISLFISGCYYTAQSYNHGKLLDPGNSMFTVGAGASMQDVPGHLVYNYTDYNYDDSGYGMDYYDSIGVETRIWRNIALNYQLGVHEKYPFGGGLEIGLLWEFSYYKERGDRSSEVLPALDFNVRTGFKDIVLSRSLYQHNLEIGWTTGMWVDNGMFLGYAGGWEFENIIPYAGLRLIYMPTNLLEHEDVFWEDNFEFHDRKFNARIAIGATIKISEIRVIPDYITPELTFTGPNASVIDDYNATFHVGFRWTNGL